MKRGVSVVVSVILMLLLVAASASVIWVVVVPMIKPDLKSNILDNPLAVVTSEGNTFYDATNKLTSVQIGRGPSDEDISRIRIVFLVENGSISRFITTPDLLESRIYVFNLSAYGTPQSVRIIPFFLIGKNEEKGEASMNVGFVKGTVGSSETVVVYDVEGEVEIVEEVVEEEVVIEEEEVVEEEVVIEEVVIEEEEVVEEEVVEEEVVEEEVVEEVSPFLRTINYGGVGVDVLIDKPDGESLDVLLLYHGTAVYDSEIFNSAERILLATKEIIQRDNLMYVSVVYPEEGLLFGDNIAEAEAALLWVKNMAAAELDINIGKVYLLGHSQGGYLVTRLNTMHETDGVVANGAGPINLTFICRAEETLGTGEEMVEQVCSVLKNEYGSAFGESNLYSDRSMINFVSDYKSKILFVQGMEDGEMQIYLWEKFKDKLNECVGCQYGILEIVGAGHEAVFYNPRASAAANGFLFG